LHFGKAEGLGAQVLAASLAAAILTAAPARAALSDVTLAPLSFPVGSAELRLNGEAGTALFVTHQPGWRGAQARGALLLRPQLRRDYDSGLSLALNGTFAAADPLSRSRYDGDVIERLSASARTGLGTLEVGLTDGAGNVLDVGGPKVDGDVSLDDPRTSFYRDPGTGRAAIAIFPLRTQVSASSNYAKFVYTSPSLFGAQLALSFTPSEGRQLPFLNAGPSVPGRQVTVWEAALRYEAELGDASVSAYAAVAEGRGEHKLPGQEGVSDLGLGLRLDYPLSEEITASLGGSWRQSNAYGFNVNQAWQPSVTRAQHVSAAITDGAWIAGIEYGNGVAKEVAIAGLPRIGLNGMQASLGYRLSPSLNISTGWQRLGYARNSGAFFNGAPQLSMDAVYLHLNLHTSEE
jgi:hypothetical protein